MRKLTRAQENVLSEMDKGWKLYDGYQGWYLTKSFTCIVNGNVAKGLISRGLIEKGKFDGHRTEYVKVSPK